MLFKYVLIVVLYVYLLLNFHKYTPASLITNFIIDVFTAIKSYVQFSIVKITVKLFTSFVLLTFKKKFLNRFIRLLEPT